MDEEYDVIVLGTGLTVSAVSGTWDPASPRPPRGAAAPGRRPHLPVAVVRGARVPIMTDPCPPHSRPRHRLSPSPSPRLQEAALYLAAPSILRA